MAFKTWYLLYGFLKKIRLEIVNNCSFTVTFFDSLPFPVFFLEIQIFEKCSFTDNKISINFFDKTTRLIAKIHLPYFPLNCTEATPD